MIADSDGNVYVFSARDGTLYAYDPSGALRWQIDLPGPHVQPPLLAAESNCLLYALGTDGTLRVFRTADGALLGQASLYTGGANGHPAARLLDVLPGGQVRFGAGYLTALTLNGYALAGVDPGTCARP
jgi:outer membrane protein assembly factor BamB